MLETKARHKLKDSAPHSASFCALQIIPVLETKEYGNLAAPLMCRRLGVKNQHDAKKLEEAKHEVYLKGFNDGVMIIGSYKGKKVRPPMAAAEVSKISW